MSIFNLFTKAKRCLKNTLSTEANGNKTLNTARLRNDVRAKLGYGNRNDNFTLAGAKNLTRGDLNTLLMCCDIFTKYGTLGGLTCLSGKIKAVLKKYSI